MRVLVVYGTELGGTEGIARTLAHALVAEGLGADVRSARRDVDVLRYDAVIVGGALYGGRWHSDARRFVLRHLEALRRLPVWLFSSGPLDGSAAQADLAPVAEVAALAERVGARGHATFGGRLPAGAEGFIGSVMAQERAGDWRDPARIRAWGRAVAGELSGLHRVAG